MLIPPKAGTHSDCHAVRQPLPLDLDCAPGVLTSRLRAPLVMFIILATLVLGPVQSAHASADEAQFLTLVNVERVSRGLPILTLQPVISDNLSRPWSTQMAATGRLAHSGSGQQILENVARYFPTTSSAGENVGYASSVVELHAALMASAPHRANILSGTFRSVGLGVVQANGQVWVTQTFFAVSTKAAPAPAQPAPAKPAVAAPAAPSPPPPLPSQPPFSPPLRSEAGRRSARRRSSRRRRPAAAPVAGRPPPRDRPGCTSSCPSARRLRPGRERSQPDPGPGTERAERRGGRPGRTVPGRQRHTRVTPAGAVASALALCLALAVRRQQLRTPRLNTAIRAGQGQAGSRSRW